MAFAGAGTDAYGLSGMFWNPAAINAANGFEWSSNYTFVAPWGKMKAVNGTSPYLMGNPNSGNVGIDALVPGTFGAYRINPEWVIGFAVTAPFGLSTKSNIPWKGQGAAVTSKASVVESDIIVGYRVNDWLSIAAGPTIVYGKARFSRDVFPQTTAFDAGTLRDLKDWGYGFTAGVSVKPWSGGEISLGYRSAAKLDLKGRLDSNVSPNPAMPLVFSVPVKGKITLPDKVTLALSQAITPDITGYGSIEWMNWSRVNTVPFYARALSPLGANPTTLNFHYRDGWNFALGADYRWDPRLTLRAGVSYEISPVDDSNRTVSIPDADRFWVAGGLSYALTENMTVDFGYSHGFVKKGKINQPVLVPVTSTSRLPVPLVAKSEARIDVVSLGFRYKFGAPSVASMPEVTKP